ncbi:ECF transporter S component [Vagococcus sp.]|uniref:ECF transporter S component n=1 Tax=Vagococcus sp. TaxID=1933889 RepID=UPI003F9BEBE9
MNKTSSLYFITYVGLISTACYVGRIAFSFLPNIQPVTTILILTTLILGFKFGLSVAVVTLLISNLYLGMGPWTFAQIGAYLAIISLTFLLRKLLNKSTLLVKSLFCGLMGFVFGLVISLIQAPFFGLTAFLPYYLQGLSFDFLHAVGNVGFSLILFPILTPLFNKIKEKHFL